MTHSCFLKGGFFARHHKKPRTVAREVIEGMGFELVGVDYGREDGLMCLTYYIYSEQGVNIDDCRAREQGYRAGCGRKGPRSAGKNTVSAFLLPVRGLLRQNGIMKGISAKLFRPN